MPTVRQQSRSVARCEKGNVIIITGLIIFLLIICVGVAVDMARAQILHQRISTALDAAGLAALQTAGAPPAGYSNTTWAEHEAERYFKANFPAGYMASGTITCCNATFTSGGNTLLLSASGLQTTVFMQSVGINTVNVGAASEVSKRGMEVVLAVDTTGSMNGIDGESSLSKINALETSLGDFLDTINPAHGCYPFVHCPAAPNFYMGIVPFAQSVRVPASLQNVSFMDPSDPNIGNFSPDVWQGCLTSRSPTAVSSLDPAVSVNGVGVNITYDISEDPPSTAPFQEYFWSPVTPNYAYSPYTAFSTPGAIAPNIADSTGYMNVNPWGPGPHGNVPPAQDVIYNSVTHSYVRNTVTGYGYFGTYNPLLSDKMGPNTFCTHVAIVPLQTDLAPIYQAGYDINYGYPVGNTDINLGLAWAWRAISPHWRGLWNNPATLANNLPLDYNTTGSQKVIILETDGTNYQQPGVYSAYGFLPNGADAEKVSNDLDTRTLATCQAIKDKGIIIYTIGYGTPAPDNPPTLADRQNPNYLNVPLLQACATNPAHFYLAAGLYDLDAAFKDIAKSLEVLHVSK